MFLHISLTSYIKATYVVYEWRNRNRRGNIRSMEVVRVNGGMSIELCCWRIALSKLRAGLFQEFEFLCGRFSSQDGISVRISSEPIDDRLMPALKVVVCFRRELHE